MKGVLPKGWLFSLVLIKQKGQLSADLFASMMSKFEDCKARELNLISNRILH